MNKEEFEAAARKYREEMFRLYARQPAPPIPAPAEPVPGSGTQPEDAPAPVPGSSMQPEDALPAPVPRSSTQPEDALPVPAPELPPAPDPPAQDATPLGWTGNSLPPEVVLSGTGMPPSHAPAFPEAVTADALMRVGEDPLPQGTGTLLITVRTADSALPVEGAVVTVTEDSAASTDLIGILKTDENGEISPLVLPAPMGDPDGKQVPFSKYSARVQAAGYRTEQSVDIPVFAGIASMQDFLLIPLPADEGAGAGEITYYNQEPVY